MILSHLDQENKLTSVMDTDAVLSSTKIMKMVTSARKSKRDPFLAFMECVHEHGGHLAASTS